MSEDRNLPREVQALVDKVTASLNYAADTSKSVSPAALGNALLEASGYRTDLYGLATPTARILGLSSFFIEHPGVNFSTQVGLQLYDHYINHTTNGNSTSLMVGMDKRAVMAALANVVLYGLSPSGVGLVSSGKVPAQSPRSNETNDVDAPYLSARVLLTDPISINRIWRPTAVIPNAVSSTDVIFQLEQWLNASFVHLTADPGLTNRNPASLSEGYRSASYDTLGLVPNLGKTLFYIALAKQPGPGLQIFGFSQTYLISSTEQGRGVETFLTFPNRVAYDDAAPYALGTLSSVLNQLYGSTWEAALTTILNGTDVIWGTYSPITATTSRPIIQNDPLLRG